MGFPGLGFPGRGFPGMGFPGLGFPGVGFPWGWGFRGWGVSAAEFREAMGHFATGVTVITSVDADGEPVGTTANAVTSLSLDPPLVIVCFDLGSLTLQAVRGHGAFVVNVLAAPQQHLSRNFARRGLAAAWDGVRHRRGPTGSPGWRMCSRSSSAPSSTHCPAAITRSSSAVSGTRKPSVNPNGPLVFFRGSYASLTDQDLPACG